jgi:opacity protein-like surface antigen
VKGFTLLLVAAALACSAVAAFAQSPVVQDVPLFSPQRASLAVGADYAFYGGKDAPAFPVRKEWQGGIFLSYKLTPVLSLVGGTRYGVDSKQFDSKAGLRLLVWSGSGGGLGK